MLYILATDLIISRVVSAVLIGVGFVIVIFILIYIIFFNGRMFASKINIDDLLPRFMKKTFKGQVIKKQIDVFEDKYKLVINRSGRYKEKRRFYSVVFWTGTNKLEFVLTQPQFGGIKERSWYTVTYRKSRVIKFIEIDISQEIEDEIYEDFFSDVAILK